MYGLFFFFRLLSPGRWGKAAPSGSPGTKGPLFIFRIFPPWSWERDINLTLRRWAFICLWETRSAAQMTVPILQIPLTVKGCTQNTHTHVHTQRSQHLLPSPAAVSSGVFGVWTVGVWGLDWGSGCSDFVSRKRVSFSLSHLFLQLVWCSWAILPLCIWIFIMESL